MSSLCTIFESTFLYLFYDNCIFFQLLFFLLVMDRLVEKISAYFEALFQKIVVGSSSPGFFRTVWEFLVLSLNLETYFLLIKLLSNWFHNHFDNCV